MKLWLLLLTAALSLNVAAAGIEPDQPDTTLSFTASTRALPNVWRDRIFADLWTSYSGYTNSFSNELNPAYLFEKSRGLGVGPNLWFRFAPEAGEKAWQIQDVGLKVFALNTLKTQKFLLYSGLQVEAPTSEYSREHDMDFAIRATPFVRYDIGQTRWRLGTVFDLRHMTGVSSGMDAWLWFKPYITYRMTDKFFVNLEYETEAQHTVGDPSFEIKHAYSDYMPGVSYWVMPNTKLSGFLRLYREEPLTNERNTIGVTLWSQLL